MNVITLRYTNDTSKRKKVVMFGANTHLFTERFGCEFGVMRNTLSNALYTQLLIHTQNAPPLNIYEWWLESTNVDQLKEVYQIEVQQSNGMVITTPYRFLTSANQQLPAPQFVTAELSGIEINGWTQIMFDLLPKTTLSFSMQTDYPLDLSSTSRRMNKEERAVHTIQNFLKDNGFHISLD
jgi:hypothetical protein